MSRLGRCRITTVFYFCFLGLFLGYLILLGTLNTSKTKEKESKKDHKSLEIAPKPLMIDKINAAVKIKNRIDTSGGSSCQPLQFITKSETRPVTALISFPGSGNTWLRHLIQQSTGFHTGSQYLDPVLLRKGFPGESFSDGRVVVVKTHEWGPTIRERFQKAVLLIRHPRPAIQSLYNLWRGGGHTGLAPKSIYDRDKGEDWRTFFNGYLRDWQTTNLDWIQNFTGPLHFILYDQLRLDLGPTLRSLVEFLDLPVDEAALQCTVEHAEGLYHRKPRADNFDPFTKEMKTRSAEVEDFVFQELRKHLSTKPASSYVSLFRFLNTYGLMGQNS